jgi:hypothetical protein
LARLVEAGALDPGREFHVAQNIESVVEVFEIGENLGPGGLGFGPVPIPNEFFGERVDVERASSAGPTTFLPHEAGGQKQGKPSPTASGRSRIETASL